MISLEMRRTLVKSPPELWTELSDPGRLAVHLRELGDIRIVRTDPEQVVEWEAPGTRGSVLIKPSGWGTKVTLTVLREMPEPEPEPPAASEASAEPGPEGPAGPEPPAEPLGEPVAISPPEPPAVQAASAEPAPPPTPGAFSAPEPAPGREPELEPRRGFLARLFGRRRTREARELDRSSSIEAAQPPPETTVPPPDQAASADELEASSGPAAQGAIGSPATEAGRRPSDEEPASAAHDTETEESPTQEEQAIAANARPQPVGLGEPIEEAPDAAIPNMSAELRAAEEVAADQVRAVLTSMLDRLGAAHHRPFSRA